MLFWKQSSKNGYQPVWICCGESREEAVDPVNCYYSWQADKETGKCPCCAVHFAYIPDCKPGEITLKANHQYVDIPVKAAFHCGERTPEPDLVCGRAYISPLQRHFFIDGANVTNGSGPVMHTRAFL